MSHQKIIELCRRIADEGNSKNIDQLIRELRAILGEEIAKFKKKSARAQS